MNIRLLQDETQQYQKEAKTQPKLCLAERHGPVNHNVQLALNPILSLCNTSSEFELPQPYSSAEKYPNLAEDHPSTTIEKQTYHKAIANSSPEQWTPQKNTN